MSVILRAIEQDAIPAAGGAPSLYSGIYQPWMLQIITHWSVATGRNLKDVTTAPYAGAVLQATAPGAVPAAPSRNGAGIVRIAAAPR
jgi:hypothetical protein